MAYKYDAGLKGLAIQPTSQVVWRSNTRTCWQDYQFGGAKNDDLVPLKTANRLVAADSARRIDCRVPAAAQLLLGARNRVQPRLQLVSQGQRHVVRVRRPPGRERRRSGVAGATAPRTDGRTSRSTARGPARGSGCRCISTSSPEPAQAAIAVGARLHARRSLQAAARLPGDGDALSHRHACGGCSSWAASMRRFPISSLMKARRHQHLRADRRRQRRRRRAAISRCRAAAAVARRRMRRRRRGRGGDRRRTWPSTTRRAAHSDKNFLVMPNEEIFDGRQLGGHTDSCSRIRSTGRTTRTAGQPFVETDPTYGKVYHVGSPADLMEMANAREHADLHAASALEGIDRLSGRDQGHARTSTTRTIAASASAGAWASTDRRRGSASIAACRCSTT